MITRTASARYEGFGKDGQGHVSTDSGALDDTPYAFGSRFESEAGTNPEELIAAAHAACFTMALSFALARGAQGRHAGDHSQGEARPGGRRLQGQPLGPDAAGSRPRHRRGALPPDRRERQDRMPDLEAAQRRDRLRVPSRRLSGREDACIRSQVFPSKCALEREPRGLPAGSSIAARPQPRHPLPCRARGKEDSR